ncbi:hypothetical protein [Kistimonas asteriae]|uniref:hypothetical protein n=1 Tax=Kistimonas asteriae TaxID=517724 RepID=UPI001BAB5E20|nr:hypothetical protein [Kistimonas asteriae]
MLAAIPNQQIPSVSSKTADYSKATNSASPEQPEAYLSSEQQKDDEDINQTKHLCDYFIKAVIVTCKVIVTIIVIPLAAILGFFAGFIRVIVETFINRYKHYQTYHPGETWEDKLRIIEQLKAYHIQIIEYFQSLKDKHSDSGLTLWKEVTDPCERLTPPIRQQIIRHEENLANKFEALKAFIKTLYTSESSRSQAPEDNSELQRIQREFSEELSALLTLWRTLDGKVTFFNPETNEVAATVTIKQGRPVSRTDTTTPDDDIEPTTSPDFDKMAEQNQPLPRTIDSKFYIWNDWFADRLSDYEGVPESQDPEQTPSTATQNRPKTPLLCPACCGMCGTPFAESIPRGLRAFLFTFVHIIPMYSKGDCAVECTAPASLIGAYRSVRLIVSLIWGLERPVNCFPWLPGKAHRYPCSDIRKKPPGIEDIYCHPEEHIYTAPEAPRLLDKTLSQETVSLNGSDSSQDGSDSDSEQSDAGNMF